MKKLSTIPVRLERDKYRELKHHLLDLDLTFNEFVNRAVNDQLKRPRKNSAQSKTRAQVA